ncbi:hypothetical protein ACFOHY_25640 [Rhizobium rosettiformans]
MTKDQSASDDQLRPTLFRPDAARSDEFVVSAQLKALGNQW